MDFLGAAKFTFFHCLKVSLQLKLPAIKSKNVSSNVKSAMNIVQKSILAVIVPV